ncbi:hypothetical protein [Rhizobium sp. CG5]|uniref:hypothetical protein n=1 Tax=Rhizobium sp. CG5 TaxID=2726076 RepID=UPI002034647D|nr:hypothetical protein [Rhizobium sp. CG5]
MTLTEHKLPRQFIAAKILILQRCKSPANISSKIRDYCDNYIPLMTFSSDLIAPWRRASGQLTDTPFPVALIQRFARRWAARIPYLVLEACVFFEIPEAEARETIRTTAQHISDGWREAFRQVGVTGALARDYEAAFVGKEMETARGL